MKKMLFFIEIVLVSLFGGCALEESSDFSNSVVPFKGSIEGISQKGPLLVGSSVTVQELDGTLGQTGKSFKGKVKNNKGEFFIDYLELESPYVLLEVDGYYRNEVTGKNSNGSIFLKAFANVSGQSQVNINLLTHLEYERIRNLVQKRKKSFAEAKRQADREVFDAFYDDVVHENVEHLDIFGNSEGDAALLAINILLLGKESEAALLGRLTEISNDLADDGVWSDFALKTKIADVACGLSLSSNNELGVIRKNIESWEIAEVPAFELYVNRFWEKQYGLGTCDVSKEGVRVKNNNPSSIYAGLEFTCSKEYGWTADVDGHLVGCDTCRAMRDPRDDHVYKVMNIDGVEWMASNLRYDDDSYEGAYECFRGNCDAYGYLYDGPGTYTYDGVEYYGGYNPDDPAAGMCPSGWRVPTRGDFYYLLNHASEDDKKQLFSEAERDFILTDGSEFVPYWVADMSGPGMHWGGCRYWMTVDVDYSIDVSCSESPQKAFIRCIRDVLE